MRYFNVGDIVVNSDGNYLRISKLGRKWITCFNFKTKEYETYPREFLTPVPTKKLMVAENTMKRLKNDNMYALQHPETTRWHECLLDPPEVVIFYTQYKTFDAIFVISNVTRRVCGNIDYVRINFKQQLL